MIRHSPTIEQLKARYAASEETEPAKITRASFLYMEGQSEPFAQCRSCYFWRHNKRCQLHGDIDIGADDSCGLYVESRGAAAIGPNLPLVTPEESGLYDGAVRCENCRHLSGDSCSLFVELNRLPWFGLDAKVKPDGCCNAFQATRNAKS